MRSVAKTVYDLEYDIRAALKAIADQARANADEGGHRGKGVRSAVTFSVSGLAARQANAIRLLSESDYDSPRFRRRVHTGFDELARGPEKSAACVYEQFRARLAALTLVPEGLTADGDIHAVTIADLRHRISTGGLRKFSPTRVEAIVANIFRSLRASGIAARIFAVIEVSCDPTEGGLFFEPHVHAIVAGPTKRQLKAALPTGPSFRRPRITPVYHLKGQLLYVTKFKPELRSRYRDGRANVARQRNRMNPSERAEWLDWYSRHGLSELIVTKGVPGLAGSFRDAELIELVDKLLRRRSPRAPRGP